MKETFTTSSVMLEVTNPKTGSKFLTKGSSKEVTKYYTIKKITSRVNSMDLLTALSKICKSPKDIQIINGLLDESNSDGEIVITNITKKSEEFLIARSKLNEILNRAVKENFLFKKDKGVYLINPYIFIGKRVRSNEMREKLQTSWTKTVEKKL